MNKKGMTLGIEILILCLFILLAFLSLYILVKTFTNKYETNFKTPLYYYNIEKEIEVAARKYIQDKILEEKTIITTKTLKEKNLYNEKCDGYVVIDKTFVQAYIKCDDYQTNGYSNALAN